MIEPLAWLIDTNVVSELMRPRPEPRVVAFLEAAESDLAAAAASRGLGIVTRNASDFRNIGIRVANPWVAP